MINKQSSYRKSIKPIQITLPNVDFKGLYDILLNTFSKKKQQQKNN